MIDTSEKSILRQRAEEIYEKRLLKSGLQASDPESGRLIQELEIHQIELEMQNEELLLAKEQAEAAAHNCIGLYDFAPLCHFSLSSAGKIIEMNFNGAKLLCKERSELINSSFISIVSTDFDSNFSRFLDQAFRSHSVETCELALITPGDSPSYVYLSGFVHENEDECLVTMIDLSDKKRMESKLQKSEQQRISILNNIEDVVWSLSWPDLTINYISPSVEQLFGRPIQDFNDDPSLWSTMVHPEDQHLSEQALALLHQEGSAVRECRIVRPDGNMVWINDKSKIIFDKNHIPIRIDGVSRNITESKQWAIYREINQEILQRLNQPGDLTESLRDVLDILKIRTGFDAVGIRLQEGDDFPYFAQKGFSTDFLKTENSLLKHRKDGGLCRNKDGKVSLECTCGMVISGKPDPTNLLLTSSGSSWTNNSFDLLQLSPEDDPRYNPRNQCFHQGFASVALIPIRNKEINIGLIQFNDKRNGCFTNAIIEHLEGIASHIGEALMRKQVEEELQKSNELFSLFMQHSPIFAFIKEVSSTESVTLKATENYREMIGIPGSEMIGKTMHEIFPPELAESITSDDWTVVSKGERLDIEEVLNDRIYTSIKFPIKQTGKNLLAGYSIDVTERRLLEKKLQESEQQYRLLFETAREGILVAQGTNFKFINPVISELTGYMEEEILKMPFLELVHPDDRDLVRTNYQKRLKGEEADNRYQIRIIKKDGIIRWIDLSSVKTEWDGQAAVISFVSDITERKQNETVRQELEDKYSSMIANNSEVIGIIGTDGFMKYKSSNIEKWFGWKPQELIGTDGWLTVHPDDLQLIQKEFYSLLQEDSSVKTVDYRYKCKDGSYKPIELTATNLLNNPVINGVLLNYRDITERKKAEMELQLKNEELRTMNFEKDKFFSVIAHDLLNPFQALLGFSSTMGEELLSFPLEKIQKVAVNMRKSANTLFILLENLLEWSQIQRGIISYKPQKIYLKSGISEVVALANDIARTKMIVINQKIPEGLIVKADKQMFESLLRNLIFNAIKFTSKGGKVTIKAIPISGNLVEISVRDSGIGMNQIQIDNLFRLDSQTNRKGTEGEPSTGLGLIICNDFIAKQGGKLMVESKEGKGSTFRFTLPNYEL